MEWNPDEDTPRFVVMPEQTVEVKIESMTEIGGTQEDSQPLKVDVKAQVTDAVDPGWKGFTVERRFFLGTHDDPGAKQKSTRASRDWVQYKRFFDALGVAATPNTREANEQTRGLKAMASIGIRKWTGQDGETRESNRINGFYKLGTRELSEKSGSGQKKGANGLDTTAGVPKYDPDEARRRALGE